jgi:hypothetical protein
MNNLFLIIFLLFLSPSCFSQENKTLNINPLKDENNNSLTGKFYKYKNFLEGKIIFKDSSIAKAELNYNRILGEIHFINSKGDTLQLASPETMISIIIGVDTFYYLEKGFAEILTHYSTIDLSAKKILKYIGKEKKGAYGTYSPTASITSYDSFTADDQITNMLATDENLLFKYQNSFFLVDGFHNSFPANKKNFYKLFSNKENQLKDYFQKNKVNFQKEDELKKLLGFLLN